MMAVTTQQAVEDNLAIDHLKRSKDMDAVVLTVKNETGEQILSKNLACSRKMGVNLEKNAFHPYQRIAPGKEALRRSLDDSLKDTPTAHVNGNLEEQTEGLSQSMEENNNEELTPSLNCDSSIVMETTEAVIPSDQEQEQPQKEQFNAPEEVPQER